MSPRDSDSDQTPHAAAGSGKSPASPPTPTRRTSIRKLSDFMVNGPSLVPAGERAASRQNRASAQDSGTDPQPEPSSSRREIVRTPTIKQDLAREPDSALRSRTDHRMERQLSPLVAASPTVLKMPPLPQRE